MVELPVTLGPVSISKAEYRRACWRILFFTQLPKHFAVMAGIFTILSAVEAYQGKLLSHVTENFVLLLGWSLFLVLGTSLCTAYALGKIEKVSTFPVEASWEVRDDGLRFHSPTATILFAWKTYQRVAASPSTLMLFTRVNKANAMIMPLRGVPPAVNLPELLAVITQKILAAR